MSAPDERCPHCNAATVRYTDTALGPYPLFACEPGCKNFDHSASTPMGEGNVKMLAARIAQLGRAESKWQMVSS